MGCIGAGIDLFYTAGFGAAFGILEILDNQRSFLHSVAKASSEMSLKQWITKLLSSNASDETVKCYDIDAKKVVSISKNEIGPGFVQARIEGQDGLVWVNASKLEPAPIKHASFDQEARSYIQQIQGVFSEHYRLSVEEWEDGFRRDSTPEREIAIWLYSSEVYEKFSGNLESGEERAELYRCIVACMNTHREAIWDVLEIEVLNREFVEKVIARFFEGNKSSVSP